MSACDVVYESLFGFYNEARVFSAHQAAAGMEVSLERLGDGMWRVRSRLSVSFQPAAARMFDVPEGTVPSVVITAGPRRVAVGARVP